MRDDVCFYSVFIDFCSDMYEHIEKFRLPKISNPKVIEKLLGDSEKKGDPRTKKFMEKYHLYGEGHYHGDGCSDNEQMMKKNGHYDTDKLFKLK